MALPETVSGFTPSPIVYSPSSTHYIYVRPHSGTKKSPQKTLPDGRTLFLVNLPPDATERELVLLFKSYGTVERVIFDLDAVELHHEEQSSDEEMEDVTKVAEGEAGAEDKPRKRRKVAKDETPKVIPLPSSNIRTLRQSGRSAHLIFLDASSLDRAMASASKPRAWPTSSGEPSGISHYMALYDSLRPPLDVVQAHADSTMELYEYELQKTKQKSKFRKGEAIVDEDGFTLVTRGGAYGQTLGGGVGVASKRFQQNGQTKRNRGKKKEAQEKEGFYGFQKAEKQRNKLMELKKGWEEDKAKVEKLKASRRFKPY
ncbi:ribosomal RNA-processing protein 7-domain-containing protein [Collybia nuda]|uniref:Ribosomal RNA-processing protein 7-domain-containing protein n=1 Tax=Collybia nuda TaxID=64659 RepID=A0A9P6CIM2_9AGAR|nr:ribosomal RNA-processing protein 7-domain-containing protein [Collybia nuda]